MKLTSAGSVGDSFVFRTKVFVAWSSDLDGATGLADLTLSLLLAPRVPLSAAWISLADSIIMTKVAQ